MRKSLIISISAIAATFSSLAFAEPKGYVGVQLGHNSTVLDVTESAMDMQSRIKSFSANGAVGSVLGGVEFDIGNNLFTAVEANLGSGRTNMTMTDQVNADIDRSRFKSRWNYGVAGLLGTQVNDSTRVFASLGYQWAETRLRVSDNHTDGVGFANTDDQNFDGVRAGIGMQSNLNAQTAIRVDWNHTRYSSYSRNLGPNDVMRIRPSENLFKAGLIFSF